MSIYGDIGGIMGGAGMVSSAIESVLGSNPDGGSWQIINSDTGESEIMFSCFVSGSISDGSTVLSQATEKGSFASYNKVDSPLDINIVLGIEGTEDELHRAIDKLNDLKASVRKFSLVTPYYEWQSLTLETVDYTFNVENGIGLLNVTMKIKSVREVSAAYSNVKIPKAAAKNKKMASKTNRGQVQGKTPDTKTSTSIAHDLFS